MVLLCCCPSVTVTIVHRNVIFVHCTFVLKYTVKNYKMQLIITITASHNSNKTKHFLKLSYNMCSLG